MGEAQRPRSLAQRRDEILAILDAVVGDPTIDSGQTIELYRPARVEEADDAAA